MSMIIHPGRSRDGICFRSERIEERRTVFAKEHELLVEESVVNPAYLACCSVVGYRSPSLLAFLFVNGHAPAVEDVTNVDKISGLPSSGQRIAHAAKTRVSSSSSGFSSFPNTRCAAPSPPRCANGAYSKSSGRTSRFAAT